MVNHFSEYKAYGKQGYVKVGFHKETGGYLVIHPQHGQSEWEENKVIGRLLAERGDAVILLPNQVERMSCDALRNGEEWEFKTVRSKQIRRALQQALRRGKGQASRVLCLIIQEDFQMYQLTLAIYNAVKFDSKEQLQQLAILFPDGTCIELGREEVLLKTFTQKFSP